jgi:lysophospholipase L1-like esterase
MTSRWLATVCALSLYVACGSSRPPSTQLEPGDSGESSGGIDASVDSPTPWGPDGALAPDSSGTTPEAAADTSTPVPPDDGAIAALPPDADHPWLRYYGRWDHTDPKAPVAMWSSVAILAKFEGTSVTVRMTDEQLTVMDIPGTGNYYQASVDGGAFTVIPSSGAMAYPIASGLADGSHTLVFVRRTESKYGKTTFFGLTLDAGKGLDPPDAPAAHKLEAFGDSITAGLADDDTGDWTNATENGFMSFAPQAARLLDAEWHVEARGGGSFYNDYYLPMIPWFDKTFGPHEGENDPPAGAELWDFTQWQPDVYILALGTNDWSDMYPHIDQTSYVTKYQGFLTSLRGWYPHAEIFCLAPFVDQQSGLAANAAPWDEARAYIPVAVTAQGDAHMHAIVPLMGTAATGYSGQWLDHPGDYVQGDEIHPNTSGHTKIAMHLQGIIAPIMGW